METTVLHNQSILDISIMHTGTVENSFDIAVQNNKCITDILTIGETIQIDETIQLKDIVSYYKSRVIQPSTGDIERKRIADYGIGYLEIGTTFQIP